MESYRPRHTGKSHANRGATNSHWSVATVIFRLRENHVFLSVGRLTVGMSIERSDLEHCHNKPKATPNKQRYTQPWLVSPSSLFSCWSLAPKHLQVRSSDDVFAIFSCVLWTGISLVSCCLGVLLFGIIACFATLVAPMTKQTSRVAMSTDLEEPPVMTTSTSSSMERGVSVDQDGKSNVWAIEPKMEVSSRSSEEKTLSALFAAGGLVGAAGLAAVILTNLPDPNQF